MKLIKQETKDVITIDEAVDNFEDLIWLAKRGDDIVVLGFGNYIDSSCVEKRINNSKLFIFASENEYQDVITLGNFYFPNHIDIESCKSIRCVVEKFYEYEFECFYKDDFKGIGEFFIKHSQK